ncbi:mutS protein homolog 4 [Manduca sexta]|uniref:mutS protein homolog 4 n=1 Tax=Manduca sexta TaxID=7130 RepID=UPI00188F76FE|nr:mutS protein homolog 4 [Manduca sexta]
MNVVWRENHANTKIIAKSKHELVRKDAAIYSTSSKPESSSSRPRARVLASDSAVADTSNDMCTPRNRPTALRYISSSSRGGHSGARSGRSTSTSAIDASVILAISEGRGMARGEIGMAAVDLRHPHLVLCQFSDTLLYTHTLTKINYFNPIEIIVPHTFCEGVKPSQLYQLIKERFPLVNLTTVQRRHFNDAAGRQNIQTLCAPQYSAVYLQVLHKFYALTAAAAVLKYVEHIQCLVFARESLKIEYHSSENTMIIDIGTATQLELVQPLIPSAGPTCCLLGILGPTYTIGGIRALRATILQPSCNKEIIEARLDAIEDLINNDSGLMIDLQDVIKKLTDIDKILLLCVENTNPNLDKLGEAQLNQVLLLKTTMEMVPKLVESLNTAESGRLRKIKMDFENPNYKEISERIKNIIQDDAHLEKGAMGSLQRCFAVKPDINGLLDVARRTYSELIEDIQKIVEQLSETYDLPIRLNQNVMKGFHIVLSLGPKNRQKFCVEDLPPIFIQVHNNGASVSMTTEELVVLDHQAKESLNEIQKMSNIVISTLLKELRPFMASLYTLCEDVAELDILLALTQASSIGSYVRPEFNTYLEIRNSVHPLLDYNSQVLPIPNDIFASPEHNFTIITGPNMGGKSIYIKQIAIMQVMAQLGCFLPATNCVLRLCDRLFSRIGFNDSVELNASTFVLEMKEIQHILKSLTPTSLVIIDELCRGTSCEEGTSIAWAICEELMMSNAFTFFTTHFMYLTRLQELYYNVVNKHTAVIEEIVSEGDNTNKRLVYTHKVELGVTKLERYGLALAAKTNLPDATVQLANELADLIVSNRAYEVISTQKRNEELLYNLNANIRHETRKNTDSSVIIERILQKFTEENPGLIEKLKTQINSTIFQTDSSAKCSSAHTSKQQISAEYSKLSPLNTNNNNIKFLEIQNIHHKPDNEIGIRSSNELITSMINNNPSCSDVHKLQYDLEMTAVHNNTPIEGMASFGDNVILENFNNVEHNGSENLMNNNSIETNHGNYDKNVNEEEMEMSTDSKTNEIDSSDESDVGEALTQLIDECSAVDMEGPLDRSNDMSVDEELMLETVDEINEELNNKLDIENIVLTPPIDFRDI